MTDFYHTVDILGESYMPTQAPRYTEVPSFLRVPHVTDLSRVDTGFIGIPYDGGLTCRTGARYGPREVRNQSSMMRAINVSTGVHPLELCRGADVGDVRFRNPFNLEEALGDIERYYTAIVESGVIPIGVGGDHSVPIRYSRHSGKIARSPLRWCTLMHTLTPGPSTRGRNTTTVLPFG